MEDKIEEWKTEPDKKEFKYKGYECEIIRHPHLGHLCGYVTVYAPHPAYGKDYYDLTEIECHGGLTYSCTNLNSTKIGFDCAHIGDYVPYMVQVSVYPDSDVYRNMEYVKNECIKIVDQLEEMEDVN